MPEIEEMPHGLVRSRAVGCGDRRDALVERHQRVDDDEAIAVVEEVLELLVRLLGEDEQSAVGRAVHQPVEQGHLALVLVLRRAQDDAHVLLVERLRRAGEDGREEDRSDPRHRHADEAGPAGREPTRRPVDRVAVLPDDLLDELAGLGRDVAAAVHDARDRRDRDAGDVGDLADRDAPPPVVAVGKPAHRRIEARSGTFRKCFRRCTGLFPPDR